MSSYEEFAEMTGGELQHYLAQRGLPTYGTKQEQVARAFSAMENNIQPVQSDDLDQQIKAAYTDRWKSLGLKVDPLSSAIKWDGDLISRWPSVDLGKIFKFVVSKKQHDLEVLGQYKSHKAYSYWRSRFVDKLFSHTLSDKRVLIKGNVSPSQRVRDDDRQVWLLLNPDGNVVGGWCNCTAGFGETCNHAIAMLYKLEYATDMGYNSPTCTSMPCQWNDQTRRLVTPVRAQDLVVRKDSRLKGNEGCDPSSLINPLQKLEFDPRRQNERTVTDESVSGFLASYQLLRPSSNLFKVLPKMLRPGIVPKPITELAEDYVAEKGSTDGFMEFLCEKITNQDVAQVQKEVAPLSEEWHAQRTGRITASNFGEVGSKMLGVLQKKRHTTIRPMLAKLMGLAPDISHLAPLKWGREHEAVAKSKFLTAEGPHHHVLKISDTGLIISVNHPFLAATPDALLACQCCAPAVLEVKCPYSIRDMDIHEAWDKTDFLTKKGNEIVLKRGHKYYAQIQGQMAIANCQKAYLMVWTEVGQPVVESIEFDIDYWKNLQERLVLFFKTYMLKLVSGEEILYMCSICSKVCLEAEEISSQNDNSVQCDACMLWYHLRCIPDADKVSADNDWHCPLCNSD